MSLRINAKAKAEQRSTFASCGGRLLLFRPRDFYVIARYFASSF